MSRMNESPEARGSGRSRHCLELAVCLATTGLLLTLTLEVACTTAWITAYQREQESKAALRPSTATSTQQDSASGPSSASETRVVRVHALVSDGFRTGIRSWQVEIQRQFDGANELLAKVGARFEVVKTDVWQYGGGTSLQADLAVLQQAERGNDVDWVVGFVPALGAFTVSIHELGRATLPGKHAVVRAFDDTHELEAFVQAFQMSTRTEIENLFELRRHHKKAVVLVHEWAHGLGVIHDVAPDDYMHPSYDAKMLGFSTASQEVIDVGLHFRTGPNQDVDAWRKALTVILTRRPNRKPDETTVLDALASVSNTPPSRSTPAAKGVSASNRWEAIKAPHRPTLTKVFDLCAAGDFRQAWQVLSGLREQYRDHPAIGVLSCVVALHAEIPMADDVCRVAELVSPTDPVPHLEQFLARVRSAGPEGHVSRETLALLKEACTRASAGTEIERDASVMLQLADTAVKFAALGCARQSLAAITDPAAHRSTAAALAGARNWLGIPEAVQSIDGELEFYLDQLQVQQLIAANRLSQAEALARQDAEKWPWPGWWSTLCEVLARQKNYKAARPWCDRALGASNSNARAHYVAAIIDLHASSNDLARQHLQAAIDAAPEQSQVYELLGQLLRQVGNRTEAESLRQRHRGQFMREPPF